ncbi:hypothetical protein FGO68_gene17322 [Halteria grandinella]|uniref:NADAR domain-containing protein n=1 Tax=Halteria grandinella TaxID=5974 RepID=A0A8J8NIR3_HALGN|nr:hypothetical protein FGO68_gene17322 [Halteria grandinella]
MEETKSPQQKKILFYKEKDPYGFMSNFYKRPIELNDQIWPTTEHYFQAMKYPSLPEYREKIRVQKSCTIVKRMGQKREGFRADWEKVKEQIMKDSLIAKFTQHKDLQKELLNTGDAILVEHSKNDKYWADGGDGGNGTIGKNALGKILQQVRSELRQALKEETPKQGAAELK